MADEVAAPVKTNKPALAIKLVVNGELNDNVSHILYRTGDIVAELTPFLILNIAEGLASVA